MIETAEHLIRRWTSLGAGFEADPLSGPIDLERLILETSRHAEREPRLFVMAATWLNEFGSLVAEHRMKRLIRDELEAPYKPALGLLLDTAQQGTHPLEFQSVIKDLEPAMYARPLFEVERRTKGLSERARRMASPLALRWNTWAAPIEFKKDAIRPARWMMRRHPELITRADFRGDLRASILAALEFDDGAGESELRLAQLAGGSRAQVRSALRNLELTGRIKGEIPKGQRRRKLQLCAGRSAE